MFTKKPFWHYALSCFAAETEGGSGPEDQSGKGEQPKQKPAEQHGGDGGTAEHGFPKDTPLEQMTTEQQLAYWKHHSRKWENRASERKDYDELKRENQRLKEQTQTEAEKAIEDARKEGKSEADKEWAVKAARSEVRGMLSGRGLEGDELDDALTFVDFNQFLDDNGDVDSVKVQRYTDTVAPQKTRQQGKRWLDLGQGNRDEQGGRRPGGSVDAGRDAFKSRRNKVSESK